MKAFTEFLAVLSLLNACSVVGFAAAFSVLQGPVARAATRLAATERCDVAVFGGGFGGLYTALEISRRARLKGKSLDIALIDPTESFVFLPLLYDLTVGTATEMEVCPYYKELLRDTGVRQIKASLKSLSGFQQAVLDDCHISSNTNNINNTNSSNTLHFQAGVLAVGASPQAILSSVPGALQCAQPFYTAADAKLTRRLLNRIEQEQQPQQQRLAIVGGGYGGVELAACVKRRLPQATVRLFTRTAPMEGTKAQALVQAALEKLGVEVQQCRVQALERLEDGTGRIQLHGKQLLEGNENSNHIKTDMEPWDAVLWTAGSVAADPVPEGIEILQKSPQGRLSIDPTMRCLPVDSSSSESCALWALGDCAEIVPTDNELSLPKTAQVAMQQSETVANNVLAILEGSHEQAEFVYQDLGSMLTLGGPNAAVLSPKSGNFAPIFGRVLDTVGGALNLADQVISSTVGTNSMAKELGLTPDSLGLSLGSHGLGVTDGSSPGTLAGTVAGTARRAVYAVRMPTNQQKAVSFVSAALSTAAALAKDAAVAREKQAR